ncbi:RICIN domain-containing protein [Micromonospora sp. KC606]|uniref:RICIN domain-containing protein n=1 Tax=Micromonospora sp. KC606 TaxID=2530379 RepID=UPI001FB7BADC|nr:RICIN domain-containing protein [Micromonospora sp. KC606]
MLFLPVCDRSVKRLSWHVITRYQPPIKSSSEPETKAAKATHRRGRASPLLPAIFNAASDNPSHASVSTDRSAVMNRGVFRAAPTEKAAKPMARAETTKLAAGRMPLRKKVRPAVTPKRIGSRNSSCWWSIHSGINQQWRIQDAGSGYIRLIARHSGKCLAVQNAVTGDGAQVVQSTCGTATSHWRRTGF